MKHLLLPDYDFDTYELKLTNLRDYIKMYAMKSADGDKMAMYFPFQTNIYVEEDLTEYEWEAFDLEKRCPFVPQVEKWENGSCVKFVSGNEDTLYIGVRKK